MQYECTECGQLGRFVTKEAPFTAPCPACEEQTLWTAAFEPEEGEGISF